MAITLTADQFKAQYGNDATEGFKTKTKGSSTIGQKFGTVVDKVSSFTGGNILGKGLGQAIAQPFIKKDLDYIQKNQGEMQDKLIKAIQLARSRGQDTTKLQNALKNLTGGITDTGNQAADLYNPNKITTKQVIGDALQLGTTVASFGTYGSAAKGAQTGRLLVKAAPTAVAKTVGAVGFKAGFIQGAKAGAIAGAATGLPMGVADALKKDKSAGEIVKSGFTGGVQGAVVGGVVGGLIGGISGAYRQHKLRQEVLRSQEKNGDRPNIIQSLKDKYADYQNRIKASEDLKPSLADSIQERVKGDKAFESLVKEARKQGFSDADINFLATTSPEDRATMEKMFDMTVKAQSDPRQITRAGDVLGDSVTKQVKQVQKLNSAQGAAVDKAARALQGQSVDAAAVLDRADEVLSNAGVTVGDDGSLNFSKSIFKKSPEIQKRIANALSDLPIGDMDAYELHKFKKSIDEVVNYGTSGEGLRGSSANILKSIRNSADDVLDTAFPAYNQANTDYKLTREYLDVAKGIIGKKYDLTSREGSQAFGQALRSAFSNNKSRPNTLKFIEDTHLISQKLGLQGAEKNLLDQALFVNMLEDTFGSEASTGMAGEVAKGVKQANRVVEGVRNPIKGALDVAASAAEKFQNITPEAKKQVIRSFLQSGPVITKTPPVNASALAEDFTIFTNSKGEKFYYVPMGEAAKKAGSFADEAANLAKSKGIAPRLFDAEQTQIENAINGGKIKEALGIAEGLKAVTEKEQSMRNSLIKMIKGML